MMCRAIYVPRVSQDDLQLVLRSLPTSVGASTVHFLGGCRSTGESDRYTYILYQVVYDTRMYVCMILYALILSTLATTSAIYVDPRLSTERDEYTGAFV